MDDGSAARLRTLVASDVPALFELSWNAGWNQTNEDWRRMLDLEPEGCFGIECGGQVVATATMLCYGTELAWLGMVLTHADHRHRGYARRLCEATLKFADGRGVQCVKLDATDQGRPLYASLGFEDEQIVERWRRESRPASASMPEVPFDAALDLEAFGVDRRAFLASFGYAPHRPGSRTHYLGPVIARDPVVAADTIGQIANSLAEPWFWDLFPSHPYASRIAQLLGFAPVRRLTRMVRGGRIRTGDALVYAIGGFEAG